MKLEQVLKKKIRQFSPPESEEAVVLGVARSTVRVKYRGRLVVVENGDGHALEPGDRVFLQRVKQALSISGILKKAADNPQTRTKGSYGQMAGGDEFATYNSADAATIGAWLNCSEGVEFRITGSTALVAGHLLMKNPAGMPSNLVVRYRGIVDGKFAGNYVEVRHYVAIANDWPIMPYTTIIGDLSAGSHTFHMQVFFTGGGALTGCDVYGYALSAAGL